MTRNWRCEFRTCVQQLPPVLLLFLLQAVVAERSLHAPDVPYSPERFYAWAFVDCYAAFLLCMRFVSHRRSVAVASSGYALPYGQAAASAKDMGQVSVISEHAKRLSDS
jgi:hypothetical protein